MELTEEEISKKHIKNLIGLLNNIESLKVIKHNLQKDLSKLDNNYWNFIALFSNIIREFFVSAIYYYKCLNRYTYNSMTLNTPENEQLNKIVNKLNELNL